MRNYVSKCFLGVGVASEVPATISLGEISVYDFETGGTVIATTKQIAFARGLDVVGEPILSGPIDVAGIQSVQAAKGLAAVQKVSTLTVATVPTVNAATGNYPASVLFNVTYHDNLSIIPNQMKQTTVSVVPNATNTASTTLWAAAIAAAFTAQEFLYVTAVASSATVVFTGIALITATKYNGIDRPEFVIFEVGFPTSSMYNYQFQGSYTLAATTAPVLGEGSKAKLQWLESQFMGRQGFADRTRWDDTKKYPTQINEVAFPVATVADTDIEIGTVPQLVINGDNWREGDMQGLRANPVGQIVAADCTSMNLLLADLRSITALASKVPADWDVTP
jgi:hypothetical protein